MTSLPTIILAEDDEGHAALLKIGLRRAGFQNSVKHLGDGKETLDFLAALRQTSDGGEGPFVLMLDLNMPKVSGFEVLHWIRHHPELGSMPVIIVSTSDDPTDIKRCKELGCDFYLTKTTAWGGIGTALAAIGPWLKPANGAS